MNKFSKFYLYTGGIILVTTAIGFLYMVLFDNEFGGLQWLAAGVLALIGGIFMACGHYMEGWKK